MSSRPGQVGNAMAAAPTVTPPPEMVRLGAETREHLITLKRRTGIMNWNVLSRWALCRSLAEPHAPTNPASTDTAVEMTWKVFSGPVGDLYWWLLKTRCHQLGIVLDEASLNAQLRAHIARGAAYLVGDSTMRSATSLASLAFAPGDIAAPV